jgi:hypothetical protein
LPASGPGAVKSRRGVPEVNVGVVVISTAITSPARRQIVELPASG